MPEAEFFRLDFFKINCLRVYLLLHGFNFSKQDSEQAAVQDWFILPQLGMIVSVVA